MTHRLRAHLVAAATAVVLPLACGGRSDVIVDGAAGGSGGSFVASGGFTSTGGVSGAGGFMTIGGGTGGLPTGGFTSAGGGLGFGGLGGLGGVSGDFYPDDIKVTTSGNGCWDLTLTAFTLEDGDDGLDLFAAVRNDGDKLTCAVELAVELFDQSSVSIAAAVNTLKHPSRYLYSIDDDHQAVVFCLAPGETAMGHVDQFPPGLLLESVAHLSYRCPSLMLDVETIDAAALTDVAAITTGAGTAYTGVFENHLDVPIQSATVFVFPTTSSGRPLGMIAVQADDVVPANGTWSFETAPLAQSGSDQVALPWFDNPL